MRQAQPTHQPEWCGHPIEVPHSATVSIMSRCFSHLLQRHVLPDLEHHRRAARQAVWVPLVLGRQRVDAVAAGVPAQEEDPPLVSHALTGVALHCQASAGTLKNAYGSN